MKCAVVFAVLAVFFGLAEDAVGEVPAPTGAWQSFSGSWYATGTRQTLPADSERPAVAVRVAGTVVVEGAPALSRGFRGEALYFHDGRSLGVGRAVWTDERGDRIFSDLRGEPAQTGRRITGTITAGTGRYARLEGEYSMTWQSVVEGEDGAVQGRTADLRGKFRSAEGPR